MVATGVHLAAASPVSGPVNTSFEALVDDRLEQIHVIVAQDLARDVRRKTSKVVNQPCNLEMDGVPKFRIRSQGFSGRRFAISALLLAVAARSEL